MDMQTVFSKTEKGHNEVASRSAELSFVHRAALIQSDGKKSAEQIFSRLPGGSFSTMEELFVGGYLEVVGGSRPTGVATQDAITNAAATKAFDLPAMKKLAVRAITDLLGPSGDVLALGIERTRSQEEFSAVVMKSSQILQRIAGSEKANGFLLKLSQDK